MKYPGRPRADAIRNAATAEQARKIGRGWLKRPRKDWEKIRTVAMTRAIYTQCQVHPDFAEALLATGEEDILEVSLYDYFWGLGRDLRGQNQYGKVLMAVRDKISDS
ncbi:NADAR family protein [Marinimicrobium sp. ARAG 43.8]|uniref:NADAR family protein n=1 Tax=Marinimicrobium sp. ARAG 43.8 TaxID=3418719 RepID=UPI003CE82AA1